jgi:hypothetical protein
VARALNSRTASASPSLTAICRNQGTHRRLLIIQVNLATKRWNGQGAPVLHETRDCGIELRQFFELDDFAPSEAIDRHRELGKQLESKK